MVEEFINPNWHVIWVHYPLALLTMGILIELFSFLWKRSSVRTAGRWMILLGALASIPAATTGIYALVDAAKGASTHPDSNWAELAANATWGEAHWRFMRWHVLLTSSASLLFVLLVTIYVGCSDRAREKVRVPFLILAILGLGAISSGAWFSGEAVYRYGVAVTPQSTENAAQVTPSEEEEHDRVSAFMNRYAPPLQLHVLLMGLMVAVSFAAIGLTFRRWNEQAAPEEIDPFSEDRFPTAERTQLPGAGAPEPLVTPTVYPARFWLLATLLSLGAAAIGLWYTSEGDWQLTTIRDLLTQAASVEGYKKLSTHQQRMAIHFGLGSLLILLPLILAMLTRWTRRVVILKVLFMLLMLASVGLQIWVGVQLLYSMD